MHDEAPASVTGEQRALEIEIAGLSKAGDCCARSRRAPPSEEAAGGGGLLGQPEPCHTPLLAVTPGGGSEDARKGATYSDAGREAGVRKENRMRCPLCHALPRSARARR